MDLFESSRREKRQIFMVAVFVALAAMVLQPVVAQAVTRIRGTVTAKVRDTAGGRVNSTRIPAQGLTDVPGSSGALDTRKFAGGAGLLGVADCGAGGASDTISVTGGHVVTDLLMTGTDGTLTITSTAVPGLNLLVVTVDAANPNVIADLSTGLGVTAPLTLTAAGTDCQVVVLGHGT